MIEMGLWCSPHTEGMSNPLSNGGIIRRSPPPAQLRQTSAPSSRTIRRDSFQCRRVCWTGTRATPSGTGKKGTESVIFLCRMVTLCPRARMAPAVSTPIRSAPPLPVVICQMPRTICIVSPSNVDPLLTAADGRLTRCVLCLDPPGRGGRRFAPDFAILRNWASASRMPSCLCLTGKA